MDTPPSTEGKGTGHVGELHDIASQRRQALTRHDAPDKESVQSAPVTDRSQLKSGDPASLATTDQDTRELRGHPLHLWPNQNGADKARGLSV